MKELPEGGSLGEELDLDAEEHHHGVAATLSNGGHYGSCWGYDLHDGSCWAELGFPCTCVCTC